jgi:RNA polymerase sigma factor (sigma-70 family)
MTQDREKGRYGRGGLPEATVDAMYADYLRLRSLAKVGAIWGRSRQSMHELLASRRQTLKRKMHPPVVHGGQSYTPGKNGYLRRTCRKGHAEVLLHRVVWAEHHGPIEEGWNVRFKDGNKLNCAIENLECLPVADFNRETATGENQHTRARRLNLAESVQRFIIREANSFARHYNADPDELVQIGTLEALKLGRTWREDGGASFFTYSCRSITRAIHTYAAKQALPLDFPIRKLHLASVVRLDAPVSEDDGETFLDINFGQPEEITHAADHKEMATILQQHLADLPPRLQQILRSYYFEHHTFKEIGKTHRISHQRVKQLTRIALTRLRAKLEPLIAA